MHVNQFSDIATAVRTFVEHYDRFSYTPESRPPGICQFPEAHADAECFAVVATEPDDSDTLTPAAEKDDFHESFHLIKALPKASFHDPTIREAIQQYNTLKQLHQDFTIHNEDHDQDEDANANLDDDENVGYLFDDSFYPDRFRHALYTSFRFDGTVMTAKYYYPGGFLGIVLQRTETNGRAIPERKWDGQSLSGTLQEEKERTYFRLHRPGPWTLIAVFAQQEGDGPMKWSPYRCEESAREGYSRELYERYMIVGPSVYYPVKRGG